jgi:shikimate dehydrogenase
LPHKQAVIPLLDELSEEARAIGAVNVIRITKTAQGTCLKGFNTDTIGFTKSITPLLLPHHRKALVLGTGGASKAICYSLESMGIEWQYVSRTPRPGMLSYSEITQDIINDHTIIVNCTPVGMHPHTDACPPIPYEYLSDAHLVYDVVYNPLTTLFMQKAAAQGATTKNGLEMLHQQAIAAWEIWTKED